MNLAIDIGNTRSKLGIFQAEDNKNTFRLRKKLVQNNLSLPALKGLCSKWSIRQVILSATGRVDQETEKYLKENFRCIFLDHRTPLPIDNAYRTPGTLGRDRLAAAVGAQTLFPKRTNLIIDAGTCITCDLITEAGRYLGGNISPGVEMRLKAMHHFTAALPLVAQGPVRNLVGNTTKSALRTGAQLGALYEVEGWIEAYSRQFGLINVILTGGDANLFVKRLKTKIFVNQNLVLFGLNEILVHNVQ